MINQKRQGTRNQLIYLLKIQMEAPTDNKKNINTIKFFFFGEKKDH